MSTAGITGIVLAGGRARRMGGEDKGLIDLDGEPMIAHVLRRLRPQVVRIIVSANRNLSDYAKWAEEVVTDSIGEYDGPLAGMASGLRLTETEYAMVVPCDAPMLAHDLVGRMHQAGVSAAADVAVAFDGHRAQPVFSLLKATLHDSIIAYLESGERKIDRWFARHRMVTVDLSDRPDCFLNVNTPQDRNDILTRMSRRESA